MPEIKPFKALLYNTEKAGDISLLTAPPYDIIPPEDLESYYQRSDYNIIRLIHGKELPGDDENRNKHTRSAQTFRQWMDSDILIRDDKQAIYVYRQEYYVEEEKKVLTGIICALKIEEPGPGCSILPHEKTLGKPGQDRFELIRKSKANFSPIFGIFEDSRDSVMETARLKCEKEPLISFKDSCDITHTVFRLTDPPAVDEIRGFLSRKKIFIADGHHRYEAACRFRDEMLRREAENSGEEPFNYVMSYLVNMFDQGLTILPAHRLLKEIPEKNKNFMDRAAQEFFKVEKAPDYAGVFSKMSRALELNLHAFGIYFADEYYYLELKPDSGYEAVMDEKFPVMYKQLDVCLAHGILIDRVINLGEETPQENLDYDKDPQKAVCAVDEKKFALAVFINPTRIKQVLEIAGSGLRMPGKATYFYPKPMGGLLLRDL